MINGKWLMGCARDLFSRINHLSLTINHYFLVRQPFVPIQQVDDAAVAEAVLQQNVLHDVVVAVGVRPEVG